MVPLILCGVAVCLIFSLVLLHVGASLLARCPACSGKALGLVKAVPFGFRFYRCACCGMRCKRSPFLGRWRDASGSKDAARYRRRQDGGWKWAAGPDPSDTTCGKLLRRKRSWTLAPLVHRTRRKARVVRTSSPKTGWSPEEAETTVGKLLRNKRLRVEEPVQDREGEPRD